MGRPLRVLLLQRDDFGIDSLNIYKSCAHFTIKELSYKGGRRLQVIHESDYL